MGQFPHARSADDRSPRRLAPARARRCRAARRGAAQCAPVRARDHHAEPRPPIVAGRAGARLPRAHPRRGAGGRSVRTADDALPHRLDAAGRNAPGPGSRHRRASSSTRPARPRTATPASPSSTRSRPRSRRRSAKGIALLVHGEVTDPEIDVFDREAVFIERHLMALRRDFPELKIVLEHITTREGADYVARIGARVPRRRSPRTTCSTTATPSSMAACARIGIACPFSSARCIGVPCWMPRPRAIERFFLGTDSAPHRGGTEGARDAVAPAATPRSTRSSCTPRRSMRPARSTSSRPSPASTAPAFYGLPTQHRHGHPATAAAGLVPEALPFGAAELKPLRGGETLGWSVAAVDRTTRR